MKEVYKSAFDKLEVSNEEELLDNILSARYKEGKTFYKRTIVAVAAVATLVFMMMVIPTTRAGIVKAAEYIQKMFTSAKGDNIIVEERDDCISVTYDISAFAEDKYMEISGDRIYFVLNDIRIDITDKCSENTYFRYDHVAPNGMTHIIFVGGPIDNLGWAEFIFDEDGNYINNLMSIPSGSDWLYDAEVSIGVPTGDYNMDFPE